MMQNSFKRRIFPVFIVMAFVSCNNLSNEVENKINELKTKTESLDSLINQEVEKVSSLDSLINGESDKVKKLDSIINKKVSAIDSISGEKFKQLKGVVN